jgi:TPR repeat protein
MRSITATLLLLCAVAALAKEKPRITIQVVNSETSQRQHTYTTPGRKGTSQTNCNTAGTTNGTITDYGVGPIQTQSNGNANTNCTTTTTAATPPQTVTRYITQEHVNAILPDGRGVVLWCQEGFRKCEYLQPGEYQAEIDGNALWVVVHELSGKERKIKYRAVSAQEASATAQQQPVSDSTTPTSPNSAVPPQEQSIDTLKEQAISGDADEQYNLGLQFEHGQGVPQDYAQAATWLRKAAEQGNAKAQIELSTLYAGGQGVPQDDTQAAFWLRKAAEQGNGFAEILLGVLYELGKRVPQDYAQAAIWFRKGADQGNAEAQYNLGDLYASGHGVPQDYSEAYFWLDLAAAGQWNAERAESAAKDRDEAASHLSPADLSREQERASKWFEDHPPKRQ